MNNYLIGLGGKASHKKYANFEKKLKKGK